jgi:hypothetical protein
MGLQNEHKPEEHMSDEFISFGKHKGTRWTRVPVSYLRWLSNNPEPSYAKARASQELARRGSTYPTIEITGHAIDRASTFCFDIFKSDRRDGEGLNAWLIRVSEEARQYGDVVGEKTLYKGMKFVFEEGEFYPSLKTIIRA